MEDIVALAEAISRRAQEARRVKVILAPYWDGATLGQRYEWYSLETGAIHVVEIVAVAPAGVSLRIIAR